MNARLLCAMALAACVAGAGAQPLPVEQSGGVRWRCGGIGVEERDALAKMERGSNLKVVFAAGARGEYVANVGVTLTEGKGAAVKFVAQGPICLINAPAGRYRVEASFGDAKRDVSTTLAKDPPAPAMVVIRFPELD